MRDRLGTVFRGGTIDSLIRINLAIDRRGGAPVVEFAGTRVGMAVSGTRRRALAIPRHDQPCRRCKLLAKGPVLGYSAPAAACAAWTVHPMARSFRLPASGILVAALIQMDRRARRTSGGHPSRPGNAKRSLACARSSCDSWFGRIGNTVDLRRDVRRSHDAQGYIGERPVEIRCWWLNGPPCGEQAKHRKNGRYRDFRPTRAIRGRKPRNRAARDSLLVSLGSSTIGPALSY